MLFIIFRVFNDFLGNLVDFYLFLSHLVKDTLSFWLIKT